MIERQDRRLRYCIAIVLFATLLANASTYAMLPATDPWKRETTDGKYVLVMLGDYSQGYFTDFFHAREFWAVSNDQTPEPYEGYSQSGLYRNDGSRAPIWTIPSYHFEPHEETPIFVSDDGRYYVAPDSSWNFGSSPLAFYCDGRLLTCYDRHRVVPWWRTHLVADAFTAESIFYSFWYTARDFDSEKLTYTFTTNRNESVTFDVTTGGIIRRTSWLPRVAAIPLCAFPFVVFYVSRRREYTPPDRNGWRFTLREGFVLFTFVVAFLGLPFSLRWWESAVGSFIFPYYVATVFGAGALAWSFGRTLRSFVSGSTFAVYSVYVVWLAISVLVDLRLLQISLEASVLPITVAFAAAFYVGCVERRRRNIPRNFAII